jgi:radical SAM superfamily enzyme YgiQ (UPF0313 family)
VPALTPQACRVALVYPRFTVPSFWNFRSTCEMAGARYPEPPLGLITVAAMLPPSWEVRLIDRNVETLGRADIEWADLVLTGGMQVQQPDTLEVIRLCRELGTPVAAGGPDITSCPHLYGEADFLVVGEAELVMDDFIAAWNAGQRRGRFEAEKFKADVRRSPVPRFDLLTFDNYLHVGVQYSRGCPFTCEFCDIIELYGRVPRTKSNAQMLAELETLYRLGYRGHVDFVDDNFIGNKKAIKQFLPELIAWQRERGYPFEFSTEASLNLADDDQLLALMHDAKFFAVFMGIESPDSATLVAMQKKQNTRRSIADSVNKIYAAGMFVIAGFIIGFDSEKDSVADAMVDCVEATSIPVCMVGTLFALPNTQLSRRLAREGRLADGFEKTDGSEQCLGGLNFVTLRPRREIMLDYVDVLERLYQPAAYFRRVRRVARQLRMPAHKGSAVTAKDLRQITRFVLRMPFVRPAIIGRFWATAAYCLVRNPAALKSVIRMMSLYVHLGPFSALVIASLKERIALLDRGELAMPQRVVPAAPELAPALRLAPAPAEP